MARISSVAAFFVLVSLVGTSLAAQQPELQWLKKPDRETHTSGAVGYDTDREVAVLFGGSLGLLGRGPHDETWEWDGVRWILREPATRPPAATHASMVYDPLRRRMVMFHYEQGETWEWDGADWVQRTTSAPTIFFGSMVYDEARSVVVLQAGTRESTWSTWEWDGLQWTSTQPQVPGPPGSFLIGWGEIGETNSVLGSGAGTRAVVSRRTVGPRQF